MVSNPLDRLLKASQAHHDCAEQYIAAGRAARLVTSLGLHREPTCQLRQTDGEDLRVLFWTAYILEKTISLWQGRPSCLNVQDEIDTALPKSGDVCVDDRGAVFRVVLTQAENPA